MNRYTIIGKRIVFELAGTLGRRADRLLRQLQSECLHPGSDHVVGPEVAGWRRDTCGLCHKVETIPPQEEVYANSMR